MLKCIPFCFFEEKKKNSSQDKCGFINIYHTTFLGLRYINSAFQCIVWLKFCVTPNFNNEVKDSTYYHFRVYSRRNQSIEKEIIRAQANTEISQSASQSVYKYQIVIIINSVQGGCVYNIHNLAFIIYVYVFSPFYNSHNIHFWCT